MTITYPPTEKQPVSAAESSETGNTSVCKTAPVMSAESELAYAELLAWIEKDDAARALASEMWRQSMQKLRAGLHQIENETDPEIRRNALRILPQIAAGLLEMNSNVINGSVEVLREFAECFRHTLHSYEATSGLIASQLAEEEDPEMKRKIQALAENLNEAIAGVKRTIRDTEERIAKRSEELRRLQVPTLEEKAGT